MLTQNPTKSRLRIIEWRPLWPVTHVIGADPTKNELTAAVTYMANANAVWPDELAVGFLPLGVNQDPTVLRHFLRVIILLMHQRTDAVVNVLHKIKRTQNIVPIAALFTRRQSKLSRKHLQGTAVRSRSICSREIWCLGLNRLPYSYVSPTLPMTFYSRSIPLKLS